MMVTFIATSGVIAILMSLIVALGKIEQHLAPRDCRLELATRPDGSTPPRRADAPFDDRSRTGRMRQIITGGVPIRS